MSGDHGRRPPVEFGFEASLVDFESGVVPFAAPLGFVAGSADEVSQGGGEDAVALVDDVLGVAQEVGKAGLLVFRGPAGLARRIDRRPTLAAERRRGTVRPRLAF